jgi:hypothetical protein
VSIFFLYNPLLEFYFFSKNCWRAGGWGWGGDGEKVFSGHKRRGQKNFSGLTSVQLRLKNIFPEKFFLQHD